MRGWSVVGGIVMAGSAVAAAAAAATIAVAAVAHSRLVEARAYRGSEGRHTCWLGVAADPRRAVMRKSRVGCRGS